MWWVEFDTNQTLPWHAAQARIGAAAISTRDAAQARIGAAAISTCAVSSIVHAAQASFMSAAMPVRGDFYYFILTFLRLEYGSCVQKKGTTAMQKKGTASCCRGK